MSSLTPVLFFNHPASLNPPSPINLLAATVTPWQKTFNLSTSLKKTVGTSLMMF